jgi:hypothetical protein
MMLARRRSLSAALFWLSVVAFVAYSATRVVHGESPAGVAGVLVIPVLVYGLAHALRAVRLGVLLGAGRARRLLGLYFYTAACSAVIPFKLGELVRINEIAWWSGSYWRGLLIVWIERVFDVVALGGMALFILGTGAQEPKDIGLLLWVIGGFVFLTVLFFFIVPEQLCGLNLHVMRSYKGRKAVHILRMLDSCYQLFEQVRPLLAGKLVTLSLLTLFIWGAELLAVAMLLDSNPWLGAVTSLVRQFALVLGDGGRAAGLAAGFEDVKMLALIALGVVALAFYGRLRIQAHKGGN